jgi:hypothetical protein
MHRTKVNYSINSSARASTEGGIVRPRALAVLRLTTSSYLVGVCTGRYRALITPQLIGFLTNQSFRIPYRRDTLDPLEVLAYDWRGAHYEFLDSELQQSLAVFIGAARGLCGEIERRIFPELNNPGVGSPLTDEDRRIGIQQSTRDAIARMRPVRFAAR